jgi:uncharacterized coiled-coil protein SlyX
MLGMCLFWSRGRRGRFTAFTNSLDCDTLLQPALSRLPLYIHSAFIRRLRFQFSEASEELMARIADLENKRNIAQKALERLNRRLARGGSCLQQKKNANKVRWELQRIKNLKQQLRQSNEKAAAVTSR